MLRPILIGRLPFTSIRNAKRKVMQENEWFSLFVLSKIFFVDNNAWVDNYTIYTTVIHLHLQPAITRPLFRVRGAGANLRRFYCHLKQLENHWVKPNPQFGGGKQSEGCAVSGSWGRVLAVILHPAAVCTVDIHTVRDGQTCQQCWTKIDNDVQ